MTERKLDVPPYQLYPLIPNALVFSDLEREFGGRRRTVSSPVKAKVTAVQAFGPNIYLGCTDGQVLQYTLEESGDGVGTYRLGSTRTLPGNQAILSMQLAHSISKLLVHIDQFLYFLSIPTLDLVSIELIRPMKNVLGFAINETPIPGEPIGLSIIKRSSIAFWDLTSRLQFVREINISSVIAVKRAGSNICIADTDQYSIIDPKASTVLPVHPISVDSVTKVLPQMFVAGRDEYFCVTYNTPSSIGTFINSSGDPCRSPMTEWVGHPESVCIDEDLLISSMPNCQVQVHNISTQDLSQTIKLSSSATVPPNLVLSRPGFSVPINQRKQTLQRLSITVPPTTARKPSSPLTRKDATEPSGSGLTPPPTPVRSAASAPRTYGGANRQPPQFPKAHVIIFGPDCVYALLPSTIISQADGLIDSGKVQDAAYLVAQVQKKLAMRPGGEGDMADDIRYIHQQIGLTYLRETAFEEAGDSLFRGDTDPRLLIQLFPEFRQPRLTDDFTLQVFAGLESQVHALLNSTISEIVSRNIVRNYAPHLKATTGEELETTLQWNAQQMLGKYLRKFRNRRQFVSTTKIGEMYSDPVINRAVDTVLVELLAASADPDDVEDLKSLLDESAHLVLEDVESTLVHLSQFGALARMYEKKGSHVKHLELLVKVADGDWRDPTVKEPIAKITTMLQDLTDRTLVEKYALWLLQKDPDAGLRILTSIRDGKRSRKENDLALLQQIRQVDAFAAHGFVEHLVLEKRSVDPSLHTQLAMSYLERFQEHIGNPTIAAFYSQLNQDYSQRHTTTPFLAHLAFGSPDGDHKRIRLKLALFLQGSSLYDVTQLRERLLHSSKILNIELAIVDGKLDLHKEALSILVNDLQDPTTAEAYCSLGGRVIPSKIAIMIGEELGLGAWASLIIGKERLQRTPTSGSGLAPSSEEEKKKQMLTRMLVEVYINSGKGKTEHAAKILNAQAINLEVGEVLSVVPPEWPLSLIASFLSRSFRRTLHDRYESLILKQLSAGQNLQTSEFAFETFAAAGAVIEEAAPGQDPKGYIVVEDEYRPNQQAVEAPEGEENPAILSNGEKEKALPPLSITQGHEVSVVKETPVKETVVSPTLSPTRPSVDVP